MDLKTLIRKVQRLFGDGRGVIVREPDIIDWANDGQLQIVRDTKCLVEEVTVAANAFPWSMPADFLDMGRITYDVVPLASTTVDDLDAKRFDQTIEAQPFFYYAVKNQIRLYPVANTTDTTSCVIQYLKIPAALVTPNDDLSIPVMYHEDLVQFCLARAHSRNENYKGYETAMNEYLSRVGSRISEADDQETTYPVIRDDPYEAW